VRCGSLLLFKELNVIIDGFGVYTPQFIAQPATVTHS
jgi:hypothetical protein